MLAGSDSTKNRRRRRISQSQSSKDLIGSTSNDQAFSSSHLDYFDDYESDDDKGHRLSQEDRAFRGACSLGRFLLNPCYCMFTSAQSWWRTVRRRRGRRGSFMVLVITTMIVTVLIHLLRQIVFVDTAKVFKFSKWSFFKRPITPRRPFKDRHVNQIPLLYNNLRFGGDDADADIGGWRSAGRRFFLPHEAIGTSPVMDDRYDNEDPGVPDFGRLKLFQNPPFHLESNRQLQRQISNETPRLARQVQPNDNDIAKQYWIEMHRDTALPDYYEPMEAIEDKHKKCRRPTFKDRSYPSCNHFHEKDLSRDYDADRAATIAGDDQVFDTFLINHGYYRDVWVVNHPSLNVKSILKTIRWKHDYEASTYSETLMDALVMERLSASPRIVDIYGHCGSAVWVEAIPYEVEEVIIHGDGYIKPEQLLNQMELQSFNDYTPEEKLDLALAMAESLADMHGYPEGVIVHDDVQLCQWLRTKDGTLKLGDFNRAEVMDYNLEKKEYCRYNNGHAYGNYRAPEEFAEQDLDEKIDVFSFGNNIYALLTGLWNFYDNSNDDEVQKLVIDGKRAFVDPRWKERSYIESKLVEVMEQCWEHDPTKRIDIFTVIQLLREISKQSKSQSNA